MHILSTEYVRALREQQVPLINVLPQTVHDQKHITDSYCVPLSSNRFIQEVALICGGKENQVIVYCASAACDLSAQAAAALDAAGFINVIDYAGGIAAWEEAGLALSNSEIPLDNGYT